MYSYDPPALFAGGQEGKWWYHGVIDTEEVGLFRKAFFSHDVSSSTTNLKHNNGGNEQDVRIARSPTGQAEHAIVCGGVPINSNLVEAV